MLIRPATEADVPACDEIYRAAKEFMHSNGNPDQWNLAYPSGNDVMEGIADGTSFVCEEGGEVIATFFYRIGADPTYSIIYDGKWLSDEKYGVIHRIAVKYQGRGIIGFIFDEMFKAHPNLRIDTHENNLPMQRALSKAGFKYCGVIHLPDGAPRIAFQKI
ncbi:MAG: GNAT family N-acetyltransferase [Clostridia bacterium]|nr:GNAT family N-acetyltransferase [Clostridia bacterium]